MVSIHHKTLINKLKQYQLLKKLDDLKFIGKIPKLYLANYFEEMRNYVDQEMFPKQIPLNKDNESNRNWKEMISKIESFENSCKNTDELKSNLNRIDEILKILNDDNEASNLEIIEDKIQEEEFNLLKKLFKNKTIIFENILGNQDLKRLLIVNDEYFTWTPIDKR